MTGLWVDGAVGPPLCDGSGWGGEMWGRLRVTGVRMGGVADVGPLLRDRGAGSASCGAARV